jgi:hypothetical protein
MLGNLIQALDEPGTAETALIEAGELALLARLEAAARSLDMSTGALAAFIARRWVELAGDDDWLRLAAVMGRSDRPGLAALVAILGQAMGEWEARQAAGRASDRDRRTDGSPAAR